MAGGTNQQEDQADNAENPTNGYENPDAEDVPKDEKQNSYCQHFYFTAPLPWLNRAAATYLRRFGFCLRCVRGNLAVLVGVGVRHRGGGLRATVAAHLLLLRLADFVFDEVGPLCACL